ncbi:MAG TPA: SDR family NAD(P)-dependent oxidoreductase [Gaiellaceae bacterium]|nr:SDR family NAD(P)-dependent oxidoreductase [Gaiellaceae bacterium]
MKALVTGGAGGIGRAIAARLSVEGYEVEPLDLVDGFDVSDPAAWEAVGPVDVACLNAGVLTGEVDVRELSDEQYRRALGVNVDGVVYGVRRLARVMERGSIVVTASLAGLTGMPSDAIYSLTKHALVGFVRSVAPQLEPVTINAVCPGIADTPMIDAQRDAFAAADFPLVAPEAVADAVWRAATSGRSGEAWFVQPGRDPAAFRFPTLPGPRREGERVGLPPLRRS